MERLDVKTPTSPVTGSVSGACSLMIQPAALMATWLAVAAVSRHSWRRRQMTASAQTFDQANDVCNRLRA